jgi:hypothetical protein
MKLFNQEDAKRTKEMLSFGMTSISLTVKKPRENHTLYMRYIHKRAADALTGAHFNAARKVHSPV